ncbi:MAG: Holliday junction ATP-dependent DNA helicase RuvB [Candidatus Sericytochromatia bacterium]|nr:MAG: Holliday junction ATP-dependent DNA helicase RuvB [Candidatus Sericytochromatia bacterium]
MAIISSSNQEPSKRIDKEKRIVENIKLGEDSNELKLRPQNIDEYIGQKKLKESLKISLKAAKQRNEAIDHILFYGPPGLGKTTLSMIIAKEMGSNIKITSAPALERPRDIAGILMTLQDFDILFIDEIHRLNKVAEEILYPAMEDFSLDITIGKGHSSRIKRIPLKKFTLIGATTKMGSLTSPLRDRFGIINRLEFYDIDELQKIIERSSKILNIDIDSEGALEIAKRSRGTPRIANRLLKRVRDFAQVNNKNIIDKEIANLALNILNIDEKGLDQIDRLLINTIIDSYRGGPVGIETIASAINEDITTIEDVYEPYLIQIGFLNRTPRGRIATIEAYKYFKKL